MKYTFNYQDQTLENLNIYDSLFYVLVMTKIDYTKNHFVDINDIFRWYKLISRFNCLWENSRATLQIVIHPRELNIKEEEVKLVI